MARLGNCGLLIVSCQLKVSSRDLFHHCFSIQRTSFSKRFAFLTVVGQLAVEWRRLAPAELVCTSRAASKRIQQSVAMKSHPAQTHCIEGLS